MMTINMRGLNELGKHIRLIKYMKEFKIGKANEQKDE